VYRVGYLTLHTAKVQRSRVAAFKQGLQELGYLEGKNIVIEERYAAGRRERLPALAAELVRLKVDVILAHSGVAEANRAAKETGRTIPIVFAVSADPVGRGLVASLARPGGNITGLSDFHSDLVAKRLELLKMAVPSASRVAVLWTPRTRDQWKRIQAAAPALDVTLLSLEVRGPDDVDRVFAMMRKERPDALNIFGSGEIGPHVIRIADFAFKNRLPAMYTVARFPEGGGLMSYGANFDDIYRRAAYYVDKILRGANPADLPVEQPTKFDLVINLKTAKAIGLTIPPEVLFQATKVIK